MGTLKFSSEVPERNVHVNFHRISGEAWRKIGQWTNVIGFVMWFTFFFACLFTHNTIMYDLFGVGLLIYGIGAIIMIFSAEKALG